MVYLSGMPSWKCQTRAGGGCGPDAGLPPTTTSSSLSFSSQRSAVSSRRSFLPLVILRLSLLPFAASKCLNYCFLAICVIPSPIVLMTWEKLLLIKAPPPVAFPSSLSVSSVPPSMLGLAKESSGCSLRFLLLQWLVILPTPLWHGRQRGCVNDITFLVSRLPE